MSTTLAVLALAVAAALPLAAGGPAATDLDSPYVLGHTMTRIDGTEQKLDAYKGKVVLMVNVASRCGYTRQYEGLQKIYEAHKQDGLVVLGFPANEFGGQEPGSDSEIMEFCESRFDVTFPMFSKIVVKGEETHPLYQQLAAQPEPIGGAPRWNFTKFLVDRDGNVVARFEPGDEPDGPKVLGRIRELLAQG